MGPTIKRARFPDNEDEVAVVVCEIPPREEIIEESVETYFYTKLEYQSIRQLCKKISRECQRSGSSKILDDTFTKKNSGAQSRLNDWALHGHDRRGLERWANRDHGEKRQQEQFQTIMTILQAQDEMLAEKKVVDPEKLYKVAYKATQSARHFARMMGKADAYAIENESIAMCDNDNDSLKTSLTELTGSSSGTEKTDDEISLPRISDEFSDIRHGSKTKKLYSRLPSFLQRSRNKGKGKEDLLSLSKVTIK